jgi:uncharacterized protein YeaO (DUF488 family)
MFRLKRAYEPPARADGIRILVERLWPRGVSKANAAIDLWLKDVAPSTGLRKWFAHDPEKWKEFQSRYRAELRSSTEPVELLLQKGREGTVTLVYAARDEQHNGALVLQRYLEAKARRTRVSRQPSKSRRKA